MLPSLTSLALTHLPPNLTTIQYNAFRYCTSLALTHLPPHLTTIEDAAFGDVDSCVVGPLKRLSLRSTIMHFEWFRYSKRMHVFKSMGVLIKKAYISHVSDETVSQL